MKEFIIAECQLIPEHWNGLNFFAKCLANKLDYLFVEYAVQQGSNIEGIVGAIIFKTPELMSLIAT
ncbi:MAG: hypothetical protein ABW152_14955 [Candidatus Thiodiazotropha endolucinida]